MTQLPSGLELELVAAHYGTDLGEALDPIWKRVARRLLPDFLEPGALRSTLPDIRFPHPSLTVFVRCRSSQTGRMVSPNYKQPATQMTHGTWVSGRLMRNAGWTGMRFDCYDRAATVIPVQIQVNGQLVILNVPNPNPIQPDEWQPLPLPQTSRVDGIQFVLHRIVHSRASIRIDRTDSQAPSVGWKAMRLTVLDELGNWNRGYISWAQQGSAQLPTLSTTNSPWKLITETDEFLSTGFLSHPSPNQPQVMSLSPRLRELGVRLVLYANGGTYDVRNAPLIVEPALSQSPSTNYFVELKHPKVSGEWSVAFGASGPTVLCVMEDIAAPGSIAARMRERIGADDGRIFQTAEIAAHTKRIGGRRWKAQLSAPKLPKAPDRLEIEVVHRLPGASFIINPEIIHQSRP